LSPPRANDGRNAGQDGSQSRKDGCESTGS
jgi:hypothetical protein